MKVKAGDPLKDAVTANELQTQHDGRGRYPPVGFVDLLGERMTYPTRFGTQLRTFIDEFLAGLDDIEVGQRPFQPVPAKFTPPRSDGAKAQFGHCDERYDPRSVADDATSSLGVG